MFLIAAATEIEMVPLQRLLEEANIRYPTLITGAGPVEAAVRMAVFLAARHKAITAVVNVGVAGGYIVDGGGDDGPKLLDLYLARTEAFGDLGICYPDRIDPLPEHLTGRMRFQMDPNLLTHARRICVEHDIHVKTGDFITVAGASATRGRGNMFKERLQGCCEDMEGAAVARVCAEYSLPMLAIRCISNLVEDRDLTRWRLSEACAIAAQAAAVIIKNLSERL